MTLIALLLSSLLASFGLGFAKYYALGYLADEVYSTNDKAWIIQIIGALMTIGPVIAFFFAAPLAAAWPKRRVMSLSSLLAALAILIGHTQGWVGSIWLYLCMLGLCVGVFSVGKMACVPLQASYGKLSIFTVNGLMTISFILGMLSGAPCGSWLWTNMPHLGARLFIGIFICASICSSLVRFPKEKVIPLTKARASLFEGGITLLFRYPWHLSTSPLLWGLSGALVLAVTAYAELRGLGTATQCTYLPIFATIGVIGGNVLSSKLASRRYASSTAACGFLVPLIVLLPFVIEYSLRIGCTPSLVYALLSGWLIVLGGGFGVATNLIDAELLDLASQEGKESTGAALQSALIALSSFCLGGTMGGAIYFGFLDFSSQFLLMGVTAGSILMLSSILAAQAGHTAPLIKALACVSRVLMSLRYRISIHGGDRVSSGKKGMIVLANHPAEIDPLILMTLFWNRWRMRPVVTESFYRMPVLHSLMKWLKAYCMPDMELGSGWYTQRCIKEVLSDIESDVTAGSRILIYPSGRLQRTGREQVGAASGAFHLSRTCPDAEIVLIRSKGLWGSRFSTAYTGETPVLYKALISCLWDVLRNALIFMPRRHIELHLTSVSASDLGADKQSFNRSLEDYFNTDMNDDIVQRPRTWFSGSSEQTTPQVSADTDVSIDPQIKERIMTALKEKLDYPQLTETTHLEQDLGLDSLARAELLSWLDEEHRIGEAELSEIKRISDILRIASGDAPREVSGTTPHVSWSSSQSPRVGDGATIPSVFLNTCDTFAHDPMIADDNSGVLNGRKLKMAVILMARSFKTLEAQRIGVMLPASSATAISTMGLMLAGKTPVLLNWTIGMRGLGQAVETAGITHIVSSSRFLNRLPGDVLEAMEDRFILLEDIRKSCGAGELATAWISARHSTSELEEEWGLCSRSPEDEAAILFTSGSESAPKGVPLSHSNLLSNIRAATQAVCFSAEDALLSFLPPFHSFGLTVTTLMPMLCGLRATFQPDPTAARKLARACERWKATLTCGTPTFLAGLFRAASSEQLASLRLFVSGAEKAPATLYTQAHEQNIQILEGYGITECSPVISLNRPDTPASGVGLPLEGTEVAIVHPEELRELSPGETGRILIKGPGVFAGYLADHPSPFVEFKGEQWYDSGDLGRSDEKGNLILEGRMKRFVKIAGEMISLPAMEQALVDEKHSREQEGPSVAVHALEVEGERPTLHFCTTVPCTLEEANARLKAAGISNLSRLAKVHILEEIPQLGTGKIDYRALATLVESDVAKQS